jgi:hypothetical protein
MPSTGLALVALTLGFLLIAGVLLVLILIIAITDNECATRSKEH